MEVRILPITELIPAPYNPRRLPKPTDAAYRKLRQGIAEFGLVEPLIWNAQTGHVVGGHLRLTILRELGVSEVPVSVVELEPAREKALNILLNNAEAQGRWDRLKLSTLLSELRELPELALTGFDATMLSALDYHPAGADPLADPLAGSVEVVLRCSETQFEQLEEELNGLIAKYQPEVRVRR
jgi:ParB-like chromosome segregation protein Spo0J